MTYPNRKNQHGKRHVRLFAILQIWFTDVVFIDLSTISSTIISVRPPQTCVETCPLSKKTLRMMITSLKLHRKSCSVTMFCSFSSFDRESRYIAPETPKTQTKKALSKAGVEPGSLAKSSARMTPQKLQAAAELLTPVKASDTKDFIPMTPCALFLVLSTLLLTHIYKAVKKASYLESVCTICSACASGKMC